MIRVQKANVQYTIDDSKLGEYKKRGFEIVQTAPVEPPESKEGKAKGA